MNVNHEKGLLLIENPGTGNASVAKALRMTREAEKHALPSVVRNQLGEEQWRSLTKIVIVRDPAERFASLATAAFVTARVSSPLPWSEAFLHLLDELAEAPPAVKGRELLKFMEEGGEFPNFLLPQSEWLSAKFDVVLTTRTIAEWFNREQKVTCLRTNLFRSNPVWKSSWVSVDEEACKRGVYAPDYAKLEKLPVWSPSPNEVRFVSGVCKSCSNNKLYAGESTTNEGQAEPLPSPPSLPSLPSPPTTTEQDLSVGQKGKSSPPLKTRRRRRGRD